MSKDAIDAWFFDLGGTLVAIEDDEIALDKNNRIHLCQEQWRHCRS